MAVASMRVPTLFTAVDKFSDVVSKMTKKTTQFSNSASSAINRVDHRLNNMWGSMNSISQLAIGGGVGGLFYYAGKDVMDYETKIASLAAVTGTKIGAMNSNIESLGKRTKMSVIDVAGAFEIVGSKMSQYLKNPKALEDITNASITMSRAARMELEPAISSLTTMMNIYKLTAEDAGKAVNKLSAGETVGSKSIAETTSIIPQFGAQAVRANVSLEESIALVQTLAQSLPTEGIGRGLRNILFDISSTKTWDKNKIRAIKMAGVNFEFVTNNANKLTDRLKELRKLELVKGGTELFFKKVNSIAANTLFQNLDKGETSFVNFLGQIKELNDAESKASKNMSTLSSMIDQMKASFTNFIVTGDNTAGVLKIVKGLIGWMTDNMQNLINLIMSVTIAFLGWKVIVGVVGLINGVMTAFNVIMSVHRFIVLWATLTNVGYAESLWAVAAATLAAYWPLLLIAGALGVLVYSMWDSKKATDMMVGGQTSALDKSNMAWKNSTNVIKTELSKQKSMLNNVSNNEKVFSNMANARNFKKATAIANTLGKPLPQNTKDVGNLFSMYNSSSPAIRKTIDENQNYNENLAGKNWLTDLKDLIFNSTSNESKVKLEIYAPEDYKVKPFDIPKGLEVKTTPNQGSRGKQN